MKELVLSHIVNSNEEEKDVKRLLTIAMVFMFLVSAGFGQIVEREIWFVEALEDSVIADDTTFSHKDIVTPAIIGGILGYGALSPHRNPGTKTASYIGTAASLYLVVDYFKNTNTKDMTVKEALKEFGLFFLHGVMMFAYASDSSTDFSFKRQNSLTIRLADAYFVSMIVRNVVAKYKDTKK